MIATLSIAWAAVIGLFLAAIWLPDHVQWVLTAIVATVPTAAATVAEANKRLP